MNIPSNKKLSSIFQLRNAVALCALLCAQTIVSQITNYTPSAPSTASFSTYVSIPPATCSGIPDIDYPVMTLPTKSKDVTFNFSLQYHPNNISLQHDATNVGLGWSLFGGGVISKSIKDIPDEAHNERPDTEWYSYDDEYFYNFFGYSGRFVFKRENRTSNLAANFKISHGSANVPKIEFTNTATKGVNITSFTITDGNGISYIFEKPDFISPIAHTAYHLTKIKDQAGNIIATLEYEKFIPQMPRQYAAYGDEYSHSLKKVNALGVGSIDFSYTSDQSLRMTRNDMVQLNSMQMKNFRGEVVRTCRMEYNFTQHMPDFYMATTTGSTRFLKKLEFLDANSQPVEKYGFSYDHQGHSPFYNNQSNFDDYGFTKYSDGTTSRTGHNGVLERVTLPTGGQIAYDFGANKIMSPYIDNDFDFTGIYTEDIFYESLNFPGQSESNTVIGSNSNPATEVNYLRSYGAGMRIDRIRYFDSSGALLPAQTVTYDYRDFNSPEYDSGQMIVEKIMSHAFTQLITREVKVYYKNVKVTQGTGNGYIKYCYYTPYDTMKNGWFLDSPYGQPIRFGWRFFALLKEGLPKYTEIYSNDNSLLQRDKYYYTLSAPFGTRIWYLRWNDGNYFGEFTSSLHHTFKVSEKFSYSPYATTVEKSSKTYSTNNFLIASESSFNTKDVQNRVRYFYPKDLPNEPLAAELIAKNMIFKPMKTENSTNNEVRLSGEKNIYKNWGNGWLAPEMIQSSKGTDLLALETRLKINKIDTTTGNPLEVENEDGTKTCFLWGYNGVLLVAKIDNISYENISASTIQQIQLLSSDTNPNPSLEQQLLSYLNTMRNSSQFTASMMTSYTHYPLVGVSTITDPRGNKIIYSYDAYGRLLSVRDSKGNLVSDNKYHYRTQN